MLCYNTPILMCFEPVAADARIRDEGYAQLGGTLHRLAHDCHDALLLPAHHVDYDLVVHLKDHARTEVLGMEAAVYLDHRYLHYVGGAALYGCVYGVAFGHAAGHGIAMTRSCSPHTMSTMTSSCT